MLVALAMSVPALATSDWLASKYGSLKSTFSARSGRMEICAMWKSNGLGPGWKARLNSRVLEPVHLVVGEAEGVRDGVRHAALEALAGRRVAEFPAAIGIDAGVTAPPGPERRVVRA